MSALYSSEKRKDMFQEITVILIGILTAGYLVWKLYRHFTSSAANSPCAGCRERCRLDTRNKTRPPESKKKKETNDIQDTASLSV
jgi:hypothetical protein